MSGDSLGLRVLLRGWRALGLQRLAATAGAGRLRVLMYHGVSSRSDFPGVRNPFGYNLSAAELAAQVEYLVRRCRTVSLGDVLAGRLATRRTNVLLTFDDGYENNFRCAFPLLERHGVPALFALPTAFVAARTPLWNDLLEAAVERTRQAEVRLEREGERATFDLARPGERRELLRWLMRRAVAAAPQRRDAFVAWALERLEVALAPEQLFADPDYRPLAPAQIRAMAASGLAEFASHSVSHPMMARLGAAERRRELEVSKAAVEELSGAPCRAFCVPGGSYDGALLELVREVGFEVVLTSDPGWTDVAAPAWSRRGVFSGWDRARFADEVHGPVVRSLAAIRRAASGRAASGPVGGAA
jgi:peptidoglycan/xylan/chitin deacetylase (PgdA/CDA1 family)